MAFTWKDNKDRMKGEGIYFLTFNVNNRVPLLGRLEPLPYPDAEGHIATVVPTDLGRAVYREFNALQSRHKGLMVIAKQVMENHFHAVCWCKAEFGNQSIKMVARGFAQACSKEARRLAHPPGGQAPGLSAGGQAPSPGGQVPGLSAGGQVPSPGGQVLGLSAGGAQSSVEARPFVAAQSHCAYSNGTESSDSDSYPHSSDGDPQPPCYDCGNGANTLFETPYIRTLSHAGQLRHMIDYTHSNPDNAWIRRQNPHLYVIRRGYEYAGLQMDVMGKDRLLAYPDRQVIALSRSLTPEQIDAEVQRALRRANDGAITYTAAINEGEKRVARAVREAGHPLVMMMLEGFPPEETDAARYFHPGGIYHRICGEGRLCLLAPHASCYDNAIVIQLTEQELALKARQKGLHYTPIPHTTQRWRMIAGNVMLSMVAGEI